MEELQSRFLRELHVSIVVAELKLESQWAYALITDDVSERAPQASASLTHTNTHLLLVFSASITSTSAMNPNTTSETSETSGPQGPAP